MTILRSIWIRNNTTAPLEFLGIEIPANSAVDFSSEPDIDLQTDETLVAAILAGDVSVGDGTVFSGGSSALTQLIVPPLPLILTAVGVHSAVAPSVMFRHNGSVIQKTGSSAFSTLPFPSLVRDGDEYTYDMAMNKIAINRDGWYKIGVQLGISPSGHEDKKLEGEYTIFVNDVVREGSRGHSSHPEHGGIVNIYLQDYVKIVGGDTVDVRWRRVNGRRNSKIKTLVNSCNISIERS